MTKNIIVSLMGLMFGLIITLIFETVLKRNKKLRHRYYMHHEVLWGYHVHHSTYGLFFILLGIVLYFTGDTQAFLFSVLSGVGVIAEHTFSDGRFIFWEKQK